LLEKIIEDLQVKQTTQSVARVVDRPSEIEPVTTGYIEEDASLRGEQDSAEWLWLLWERRRFLWRFTIRGLVIVTIIAFLIPKRYESTTRLMPPDQRSGSGLAMLAAMAGRGSSSGGLAGLGSLGSIASDLLGSKTSGALFADILKGRTVQDRLIERFDLRKVYWDRYWEDARKDLTKYTDIKEDRKSGVITITVTDRDSHRAEKMAEAYVEELDRLVAQVSTSSARRERIFIEQRLKEVKRDLDNASQQFSEYASKNTIVDVNSQTKAMVEGAARLQGELIVAQSELEGLEQIYTTNNVRVRSLRARVEELKNQLGKIGGTSAPLAAKQADSAAGSNSDQLYPPIRQLPLLGVRWLDLYRETKIQETVYELLTQQYEIAKIEEAKEIPTVKVLDAADKPERKSSPKRLLLIGLGTLLALSVAIVWVLGTTTWRQMDPEDPRKQLGEEVFAKSAAFCSQRLGRSHTAARARAWWEARRNGRKT
jgi:capsule polysaccharide export protein KpsE/RkpR